MDYIIMDRHTVPPEQERWFVEKVAHLPHGRFCYAPPGYAPEVGPLPALRRGQVTFGSFNKLAKVNLEVLSLWAAILEQVPGSRLVLKWKTLNAPQDRERFLGLARQAGLDPRRLELRGESPHRQMLREYNDIDIGLDPFPFCGALTTLEALWMGLPVVTLPGRRPVSRQTYAFLAELGLLELVARDTGHYLEIARGLASDLDRLARLRTQIRPRLAASPILDGPAFARHLERAYDWMWRRWCRSRA
jgi:predicted O-linked N-acetylglucosamine transferase (SPINDLY family)